MAFTIVCENCGNTNKFFSSRDVGGVENKNPHIIINTEFEEGDAPTWYSIECTNCGHKVEDV